LGALEDAVVGGFELASVEDLGAFPDLKGDKGNNGILGGFFFGFLLSLFLRRGLVMVILM
jgi:tetrahydromethanopterin S-methyltransferase subunit B